MRHVVIRTLMLVCLAAPAQLAAAAETIRVGVLKFGTVNWELNTLKAHGLDTKHDINVKIVPFASEDATNVALRAGTVDIIVSDWLDVSRARASGEDLTLVPYSASVGAIMVAANSPLHSMADLNGRKIGVTGGPHDKSWLMIQALVRRDVGIDLASANDIVYGAPPLLAEKARSGELDAVLTFWHFAARLEAEGFRRLVSAEDAARALGAMGQVSALGYVFHDAWASSHHDAVVSFIKASRETKLLLRASDAEWQRLFTDGIIKDEGRALEALRDRYREGTPARPAAEEELDAQTLFAVLSELGGEKLVGPSPIMMPGTYWPGLDDVD